MYNIRQQH